MTDRWLNLALAIVVSIGLVGVWFHERPRLAEERAEFLGQEVAETTAPAPVAAPTERAPIEFVPATPRAPLDQDDPTTDPAAASPGSQSSTPAPAEPTEPYELGDYGVAAGHPVAVDIGMQVLEAGGNAVDAAIAVSYALGVVEPFGSGIGGGGSMVVHPWDGDPVAYDYREIAPLSGEIPSSNIGVPGFVAGMQMVHDDWGTVDIASLIEPAARQAEDGLVVGEYLRERLLAATYRMPTHLIPGFFPNGGVIEVGETVHQPEYAESLRLIQEQGPAAFYSGPLAKAITKEVSGLSMEDFAAYEPLRLEPSTGTYGDYELVGSSAPTGSPTVILMLQIAEAAGIDEVPVDSTEGYHTIAQAWRVANSQRIQYIGDPSIEDVDLEAFTDPRHAEALAATIPPDGFADVGEWTEDIPLFTDSTDTTHFVVVDRNGMMVSATNTLSNFFGSGLMVGGFWLNDQLKNFSRDPESINAVKPGKRTRSFTSPLILTTDGHPTMGIGSPGGRRIPSMVAQAIIRWAGHGEDIAQAVDDPRFHLEDHTLQVEQTPPGNMVPELTALGYEVTTEVPTVEFYGAIQALIVDQEAGRLIGAADDRRVGAWDSAKRPDEHDTDT